MYGWLDPSHRIGTFAALPAPTACLTPEPTGTPLRHALITGSSPARSSGGHLRVGSPAFQADRVTPFKFRSTAEVDDAKLLWDEPSLPPSPSPPLTAHAKGSAAMRARSTAAAVKLPSASARSPVRSPEMTPELRLAPRNKGRGSEVSIVDHERCLNCATLDDELLRAAKVPMWLDSVTFACSLSVHSSLSLAAAAVCLLLRIEPRFSLLVTL